MASHSLTVGSKVISAGSKPIIEASPKDRTLQVALSKRDAKVNAMKPITTKNDLKIATKWSPMFSATTQSYGKVFRLPISLNSIVKKAFMFATLVNSINGLPNCTTTIPEDNFYAVEVCSSNSGFLNGCIIDPEVQENMNALYVNVPFNVNGTSIFYPNMTGVNLTEYSYTSDTYIKFIDLQNSVSDAGCSSSQALNYLNYCLRFVCHTYSENLDFSQIQPSPTGAPTEAPNSNKSYDFKLIMELMLIGVFTMDLLGWVAHFSKFCQDDPKPNIETVEQAIDHVLTNKQEYTNGEYVTKHGVDGVINKFAKSRTLNVINALHRLKNYGKFAAGFYLLSVSYNETKQNDGGNNAVEIFAGYLIADSILSLYQERIFKNIHGLIECLTCCLKGNIGEIFSVLKVDGFGFFNKGLSDDEKKSKKADLEKRISSLGEGSFNEIAKIDNRYPFPFNCYKLLKLMISDCFNYIPYTVLLCRRNDDEFLFLDVVLTASISLFLQNLTKFASRQTGLEPQYLDMVSKKLDNIESGDRQNIPVVVTREGERVGADLEVVRPIEDVVTTEHLHQRDHQSIESTEVKLKCEHDNQARIVVDAHDLESGGRQNIPVVDTPEGKRVGADLEVVGPIEDVVTTEQLHQRGHQSIESTEVKLKCEHDNQARIVVDTHDLESGDRQNIPVVDTPEGEHRLESGSHDGVADGTQGEIQNIDVVSLDHLEINGLNESQDKSLKPDMPNRKS